MKGLEFWVLIVAFQNEILTVFTLWFQLIGMPQGIEHVMNQLKDMPQGYKNYRAK